MPVSMFRWKSNSQCYNNYCNNIVQIFCVTITAYKSTRLLDFNHVYFTTQKYIGTDPYQNKVKCS